MRLLLGIGIGCALVLLARSARAREADPARTIAPVSAAQASRLARALHLSAHASRKEAGIELRFAWKETRFEESGSGWKLEATISGHDGAAGEGHGLLGWL